MLDATAIDTHLKYLEHCETGISEYVYTEQYIPRSPGYRPSLPTAVLDQLVESGYMVVLPSIQELRYLSTEEDSALHEALKMSTELVSKGRLVTS